VSIGSSLNNIKVNISKKEFAIVLFILLVIGLLVYAPNLFNLSVPAEHDVRAHIFKIDLVYNYITQFSWPQWCEYWYEGFPFSQYYPPGFYFIGALFTFITGSAVISYKLLMLFILISNGLVAFYFARKFLNTSFPLAVVCLIAYQTSTALLVNYLYGTGPNLLAWSVSVVFLAFYMRNVMQNSIYSISAVVTPALLFGVTVLIHPFPAIFMVLAVILFHLIWIIHNENRKQQFKMQLVYFLKTFFIGAILSIYYWLPFILTRDYVSPIYTMTEDAWKGGLVFIIILSLISLAIGFAVRIKGTKSIKLDILITLVILSTAMGMGLSRYAPFGLNSLIHEVRFATMAVPLFSILLIIFSLNAIPENLKERKLGITAISICLVCFTSILPVIYTFNYANLGRLFTYVNNYLKPEYGQILNSVTNSRLIIPFNKGYVFEGDSLVTFAWYYGVECINGPYNQGDPNYFKYTVHLEWEERWLDNEFTRINLMQEGAAKYIFIRASKGMVSNTEGLSLILENDYGQLWQIDENIERAVSTTPIILDVDNPEMVTNFFNILIPNGYKMVFVDKNDIANDLKQEFQYVMIDDISKVNEYENKTIYLLNDIQDNDVLITKENNIITMNLPYIAYTNTVFYQGDKGDVASWRTFDASSESILTKEMINTLLKAGEALSPYLLDLAYFPLEYNYSDNKIEVNNADAGFILIKDSYFPYWGTKQGEVFNTTQGFMIVNTNSTEIELVYKIPIINIIATMITISGLSISIIVLIIQAFKNRAKLSSYRSD
jgi:uncharacterized membrane protein